MKYYIVKATTVPEAYEEIRADMEKQVDHLLKAAQRRVNEARSRTARITYQGHVDALTEVKLHLFFETKCVTEDMLPEPLRR